MKKFGTAVLLAGVIACIVTLFVTAGCAVESDGKLSGHVENPFPWADGPASQPSK